MDLINEWEAKSKKALKKFNKNFKQKKKTLIKDAKDFRPWDYLYLIYILQDVLDIWIEFYGDKYNLSVDLDIPEQKINHDLMVNGLIAAKNLFDQECVNGLEAEKENFKNAFNILGEVICKVWD